MDDVHLVTIGFSCGLIVNDIAVSVNAEEGVSFGCAVVHGGQGDSPFIQLPLVPVPAAGAAVEFVQGLLPCQPSPGP